MHRSGPQHNPSAVSVICIRREGCVGVLGRGSEVLSADLGLGLEAILRESLAASMPRVEVTGGYHASSEGLCLSARGKVRREKYSTRDLHFPAAAHTNKLSYGCNCQLRISGCLLRQVLRFAYPPHPPPSRELPFIRRHPSCSCCSTPPTCLTSLKQHMSCLTAPGGRLIDS